MNGQQVFEKMVNIIHLKIKTTYSESLLLTLKTFSKRQNIAIADKAMETGV